MASVDQTQQNTRSILKQIYGEQVGAEYNLTGSLMLMGRHPKCQIYLSNGNVSRRHCTLTHTESGWRVKDNGSQNGTYVNGRILEPDENFLLECGDILFLGPPSEHPEAFSYDEFVECDYAESMVSDDSDIITLPVKRACDGNVQAHKKVLKHFNENSSDSKTNEHSRQDVGSTAEVPNKYRLKKSRNKHCELENQPLVSNSVTTSQKSCPKSEITSSSSKITGNEQIFEISSTDCDYPDNSESILILDSENNHNDSWVGNAVETHEVTGDENAETKENLESKLALLSQQIETLKRSKLELLKNYEDVIEKNKVLDQQLADKEKNLEKDLERREVKAKNEVKSEILEKFEEELVCNICTELFIKPTVLDCSHTFCEYCIKEWKKKKNDCPICRCKIKTSTRVRTLEEFIDKILITLTPDQREKRDTLIAERNKTEKPLPPGVYKTPRRRRGRHYHRRLRLGPRVENPVIEIVHESSGSSSAPYSISSHIHYAEPRNPHVNIRALDLPLSMFSMLFPR